MNLKDVARIAGYIVGFAGLVTPQVASTLLEPYGIGAPIATHVSAIAGSIVLLGTLIGSVLARPSTPTGFHTVITADPNAAPNTLTTTAATPPPKAATP